MKYCMGCMMEMEEHLQVCPHCGYDERNAVQESYYLTPGTVIGGKYIVGKALKYGGYTVKYIGLDAEHDRRVMIGEYLPSDFSTRSQGESMVTIYSGDALDQFQQGLVTFLNEGNRIQQLGDMPGIARVYDCVAENDTGYVISEYLEGRTLKELLDAGKVFQPKEAASLICSILKGLSRLHPQDIIHCDIAPETIMLTTDRKVKLLDFGATRYVTTANSKSLAIILKQGYAPEEQYRSQGQRGPWTDVYALGAVMYRMITGKVPTESVERALEDDLQEPSKLGIAMHPSMENALMNALNVYQKDRTPSAEAFYRELTSKNTQRVKVKQRKRETGKLPVWAKGLVAMAACGLIAGGVVLVHQGMENQEKKMTSQKEDKFSQYIGEDYETFVKKWKDYGFDIDNVKKDYRYDSTARKEKKEKIKEFKDLTGGELTEGVSLPTSEPKPKKGKYIAEIVIASGQRVTFQEEWEQNCYQKDDTELSYEKKYYPPEEVAKLTKLSKEEGGESKPYGVIDKIIYDGNEYDPKEKAFKKISGNLVNHDLEVIIYTGKYFSWPEGELRKYVGRSWKDIDFYFMTEDAKKGETKEKRPLDVKFIQKGISFQDKVDTIETVLSPELNNGKKYSSKVNGDKVFSVVGEKLSLETMTIANLEEKCEQQYDIDLIWDKKKYGKNYKVRKVDKEKFCDRGEKLTVTDAEPPATPTPKITPAPEVPSTPRTTNTKKNIQKKHPSKPKKTPHNPLP